MMPGSVKELVYCDDGGHHYNVLQGPWSTYYTTTAM